MHNFKFIADMNISPVTVSMLREKGFDIIRVSEVMDNRSSDRDILKYATTNEMVILTQDLDFSMLLAINGHKKPSVITLRLDNPSPDIAFQHIIRAFGYLANDLDKGIAATIDCDSIRFRTLPIG